MALSAITRLRLRSWWFLLPFQWDTFRSMRQARRAEGCVMMALRFHQGAFWTLTQWRDAESMRAYMTAGPHKKAMPKLMHWCDEASLAHWESTTRPKWAEGEEKLATMGRVSRVLHPSPAHAAGLTLGGSGRQTNAA